MKGLSISFVLPMYNEAQSIEATLAKVDILGKELCDDYEMIVVNDASTDHCGEIVDALAKKNERIVPIHLKVNTKFGGALKTGLMAATKEIVMYTDADLPVKEDDVREAVRLLNKGADVISGYSLVLKDTSIKRIVMSKVYNFLIQVLFGLNLRDINSGFKVYRRETLQGLRLRSQSPFVDVEIFVEITKRGFSITPYGLIFQLRTKGRSTISRPSVVLRTFIDMFTYWVLR